MKLKRISAKLGLVPFVASIISSISDVACLVNFHDDLLNIGSKFSKKVQE